MICLANSISRYSEVTLVFITSGKRFTNSVLDLDIGRLPYGLTEDPVAISTLLDVEISEFVNPSLSILLGRTPSLKFFTDWRLQNFRYIRDIALRMARENFDVIHFNGSSGFQLYFHHFMKNTPKILTIHDYIPHTGDAALRGIAVNIVLNGIHTKFDYHFIQHHDYLRKKFIDFYKVSPERVHTVNSGPLEVYKAFAKESVDEEPNTILFFGRISPYKGIQYLIQAIPRIRKRVGSLKVIIAGKGQIGFKIPEYDFLEIRNRHIHNDELAELLQRSSIVVAPYTDATHSAVVMTAFAFRKPVVASSVGGIPEVVRDGLTGRLVPPRNPDALADAVTEILLDDNRRNTMKRNIEHLGNDGEFSWDKIAEKTIEIYEKAIDGGNS